MSIQVYEGDGIEPVQRPKKLVKLYTVRHTLEGFDHKESTYITQVNDKLEVIERSQSFRTAGSWPLPIALRIRKRIIRAANCKAIEVAVQRVRPEKWHMLRISKEYQQKMKRYVRKLPSEFKFSTITIGPSVGG